MCFSTTTPASLAFFICVIVAIRKLKRHETLGLRLVSFLFVLRESVEERPFLSENVCQNKLNKVEEKAIFRQFMVKKGRKGRKKQQVFLPILHKHRYSCIFKKDMDRFHEDH